VHILLCSDVKKKIFFLGPGIIHFSEDTKLWTIYLDILEIYVFLFYN